MKELDDVITPKLGEIKFGQGNDKSHKYIFHACEKCGKERWVKLKKGIPSSKFCRPCVYVPQKRGYESVNWRGGKTIDGLGYIKILLQHDDFFYSMANKTGYVFEHRLIMAKHLNRCLLPWEIVHHKNGNKSDNQIENLELLSGSKYHVIDSITKSCIRRLENKIDKQTQLIGELHKEIRLLRWKQQETMKL